MRSSINLPKIEKREISDELRESYLDYAMSVIVSRALPDARDGMKPVHRRILWTMREEGISHSAKFRKSANVVGAVLGRYHPHGDIAVYDSLVRMAQEFSLRYPLIQGQGNFGSVDGDSAAAMRYTEAKLSKIAEELLLDIEKETVDWQPNYDGSREEPKVLPAKLPNLLLNGTMGIAVGMATNIPPHNLNEVIDAAVYLAENPNAQTEDLMNFIKGPDFPTGGIIYDRKSIIEAYASGKGPITCRAVAEIEPAHKSGQPARSTLPTGRQAGGFNVVITEIPYQVNKSELIIKIAELVQNKKIEGIRDLRDESDREGMRIVIELKNDAAPQKVLNFLYKHTDIQKDFHLNMIALADGIQPRLLSLKEVLAIYLEHRKVIVERRARFDLKKAEERAHILEGLSKALSAIDKVISTIKKSESREDAHKNLVEIFNLTDVQATAILEMRLQTLAALERQKIEDELTEKRTLIAELKSLLKSPQKILQVVINELNESKKIHGDERRTKMMVSGLKEFREEDLIPQEEIIVSLSQNGYIKRISPSGFRSQRRGGTGLIGSEVGEEDFLTHFIGADTHDSIFFFTDRGRIFQSKAHEIPAASRTAKGKLIQNFLEIPPDEKIAAIVSHAEPHGKERKAARKEAFKPALFIMATKNGLIKKTPLSDFANIRKTGIAAITLQKGDELKWVKISSGKDEVVIATNKGQAIRFKESQLRPMGRTASGVKAIKLKNDDFVVGLDIIKEDSKSKIQGLKLLVIAENGFSKQTPLKEYKIQSRGGSGIKTAKITSKTGKIVAAKIITDEEELLALSAKGQIIKTKLSDIRQAGRATSGVKIMKMKEGDRIIGAVVF